MSKGTSLLPTRVLKPSNLDLQILNHVHLLSRQESVMPGCRMRPEKATGPLHLSRVCCHWLGTVLTAQRIHGAWAKRCTDRQVPFGISARHDRNILFRVLQRFQKPMELFGLRRASGLGTSIQTPSPAGLPELPCELTLLATFVKLLCIHSFNGPAEQEESRSDAELPRWS